VGLPPAAFPVTTAASLLVLPNTMLELVGVVVMVAADGATWKHSSIVLSELAW
jgi:hypothetical protein